LTVSALHLLLVSPQSSKPEIPATHLIMMKGYGFKRACMLSIRSIAACSASKVLLLTQQATKKIFA